MNRGGRLGLSLALAGAVAAFAACGESQPALRDPATTVPSSIRARLSPGSLTVGQPVQARRVRSIRRGTVELRALSPGGSAPLRLLFFPYSRRDSRDVCLGTAFEDEDLFEADEYCGVVTDTDPWVSAFGGYPQFEHDRTPIVIAGFAPPGVASVTLRGPGGSHPLPLSIHRTFLAMYRGRVRGTATLIGKRGDGSTSRQTLKLPPRPPPNHPRRRPGAVFNDEIGEDIVGVSRRELQGRFGPPVRVLSGGRRGCVYYELVGDIKSGWEFCIGPDERIASGAGTGPEALPPHRAPPS
jgi:hypothetical protein